MKTLIEVLLVILVVIFLFLAYFLKSQGTSSTSSSFVLSWARSFIGWILGIPGAILRFSIKFPEVVMVVTLIMIIPAYYCNVIVHQRFFTDEGKGIMRASIGHDSTGPVIEFELPEGVEIPKFEILTSIALKVKDASGVEGLERGKDVEFHFEGTLQEFIFGSNAKRILKGSQLLAKNGFTKMIILAGSEITFDGDPPYVIKVTPLVRGEQVRFATDPIKYRVLEQ